MGRASIFVAVGGSVVLSVFVFVVLVVFVLLLFFFRFFLADLGPALVERFFGEERIGDIRVVLARVEENLEELDAVAFASNLERRLYPGKRMVIREIFDFLGFHLCLGIARVDDFADGQVRRS